MKLLYIMTVVSGIGGVQRVIFDKLNYLADKYEIDVIHFENESACPDFNVDCRIRFHSIAVPALSSSVLNKGYCLLRIFSKYRSLIKQIKPDVIVNANAMIISWILPFMNLGIPKIVELHQSFDGVQIFNRDAYGANSWRSKLLMFLRNRIYPRYHKVVVLTHTDQVKWGYKNCITIPNFTNLKPSKSEASNDCFRFIWVGRMCHQKGVDLLLKAWTQFSQQNSNCRLIIVGGGEGVYRKQLEEYLAISPYRDSVTYVPQADDMASLYEQASAFLSTSRFEGLPLVLVEAATLGLPIVGFDITGNDEVVTKDVNGYLAEPENIDSLVDCMLRISSASETERIKLSQASLTVAKGFQKKEIMAAWEELFRELIGNSKYSLIHMGGN